MGLVLNPSLAMALRKIVHEEIVCGICSDLLKEPKILVCAHSFCKDCLTSLHKTGCKSPSTGLQYDLDFDASCEEDQESKGSRKIECPYCLQVTIFPDEHTVNSLDTHSQLEEVVSSLSPEQKQTIRENLGHRQKVISNLTEGNGELCPESCKLHEMQHQYFCTDCNTTACAECVNTLHALHQCSEISILLVESFLQLQCLVQPSCVYASRADASLKKLTQDSESIESNRNMCKEAIFEVFNEIRTAVDEREEMLLNGVDNYIDHKLSQVAHQKNNLEQVQDQLYQSVQEIQQILDGTLSDIMLLVDKQRLVEDIDVQEQNILDIENLVAKSMFSSTYIGFRDDNTKVVKKHIDMLFTLCEFYPDADTGYYSSRLITVEKENAETKVHRGIEQLDDFKDGKYLKRSNTCTKIVEEDEMPELFQTQAVTSSRVSVKRSQSTPSARTKEIWLTKKRKHTASVTNVPTVPIRFDSLLTPTPILVPEKIFNKLTVSKTESVYPCGICIGENDSFIISDVKNHCLRIIASNGKFIGAIGKEGKGSGQFEDPCGVAANEKAQIFACQRENPRIQKLTSGGKYIQKFGHKSLRGNTLGEPWALAIGPDHKMYVTDWDKSCIHIFSSNGRYDSTIGNDDSILGRSLKFPAGIAVNASSNLVVADRGNHCVWVLKTDGTVLMCIGTKGHGPGELFLPHGIAVHPNGSIIVSESGNNRISIFSPCGNFLKHFGQTGNEPGMFNYPRHVCITPSGDIIVADEQNQRLQLFKIF